MRGYIEATGGAFTGDVLVGGTSGISGADSVDGTPYAFGQVKMKVNLLSGELLMKESFMRRKLISMVKVLLREIFMPIMDTLMVLLMPLVELFKII